MNKKILLGLISSLFCISSSIVLTKATAEGNTHVQQEIGKGVIDWTDKVIKVVGSGAAPEGMSAGQARLMAERAAIADAQRQLVEITQGVRIDSETTVKDFVTQSDVIKTSVQGIIKGAIRGEKKISTDGVVDYELMIPLYGEKSVADAVDLEKHIIKKSKKKMSFLSNYHRMFSFLPNGDKNTFMLSNGPKVNMNNCTQCHKPHAIPESVKKQIEEAEKKSNSGEAYTGIIIDARGLDVRPAMDPAIVDSNMSQLYIGNWEIDPDYVIANGIIGYFNEVDEAKNDVARVGKNPLVVKAVQVRGSTDPILEIEDSSKILEADNLTKFLQKYAVDIVL